MKEEKKKLLLKEHCEKQSCCEECVFEGFCLTNNFEGVKRKVRNHG